MKLYNSYREITLGFHIHFNGEFDYEISEGDDRHTVNLETKGAPVSFGAYLGSHAPMLSRLCSMIRLIQ